MRRRADTLCGVAGDDLRDHMGETSSQVGQGFTQISSIRGAIDAAGAVVAGQQRIIDQDEGIMALSDVLMRVVGFLRAGSPEGVPAQRVTDLEGMLKALGARFPRT